MSIPFTPLRIVSLAYQHSDSDECRISDESQFNTLVDRIVYHAESFRATPSIVPLPY